MINKKTPARPSSFADQSQIDTAGPGHYKTTKNFGEGVKGHGFGKPKAEKVQLDDRDYNLDTEKVFA